MKWIRDEYGQEWEIFITENGFADEGQINDTARIGYLAVSILYRFSFIIVIKNTHFISICVEICVTIKTCVHLVSLLKITHSKL